MVDQITLHHESGKTVLHGGNGGEPVSRFQLEAGEFLVSVNQRRSANAAEHQYLGMGFLFKTSNGRTHEICGSSGRGQDWKSGSDQLKECATGSAQQEITEQPAAGQA